MSEDIPFFIGNKNSLFSGRTSFFTVAASFVSFFAGFLLAALFFAIFLTSFFADAFCTSAGFLTIFTASVLAFYIAGLCAFGFLAAFGFRFGRFSLCGACANATVNRATANSETMNNTFFFIFLRF